MRAHIACPFAGASALVAALVILAGCTPMATFPPLDGQIGLNRPTLEPIPTLMAASIRRAHEQFGVDDEPIVFSLPEGATWSVYQRVRGDLGAGARVMTPDDERAYHVQMVRVRGLDSSVDVVYPRREGGYGLVTIFFTRQPFGAHHVKATRDWRIRVEPPPAPTQLAVEPDHDDGGG